MTSRFLDMGLALYSLYVKLCMLQPIMALGARGQPSFQDVSGGIIPKTRNPLRNDADRLLLIGSTHPESQLQCSHWCIALRSDFAGLGQSSQHRHPSPDQGDGLSATPPP